MSHIAELLSAHLDGELFEFERSRVAGHLQTCEECRKELKDLSASRAAIRSLPILELPVELAAQVGLRPHPLPLRRRPVAWVAAAAAAAMVFFVGSAIVNAPPQHRISPSDLSEIYGAVTANEPAFTAVKVAAATENANAMGAR